MAEDITIGDMTFAPGETGSVNLPIADLSTHTPVTMPVHVRRGRRPGPTLLVCAAIHGDEINGVEIIRRLLRLRALKRLRGTLIAVPVVNVYGFLSQSRYLPDRRDLNRSFPGRNKGSLAARLADIFMHDIVARCSHGIDLHTGALHRDNYPQIRADLGDPAVEEMARAFGVPLIINAGVRRGSLREAAAGRNIPFIAYEAGEALRFDEIAIRAGVRGVVGVMRGLGMISESSRRRNVRPPLLARSSSWVRAAQSGVFRSVARLGAEVVSGDRLGIVADPFGQNEMAITTDDDGVVVGRLNLPLVHEGDALFHIARFDGTQCAADTLDAFEPFEDYKAGLTSELANEPPIA